MPGGPTSGPWTSPPALVTRPHGRERRSGSEACGSTSTAARSSGPGCWRYNVPRSPSFQPMPSTSVSASSCGSPRRTCTTAHRSSPSWRRSRDARHCDDPHVLAEALSLAHHALLAPEHFEFRLPLAEEQIAVAAGCGDDLRVLFGLLWKAVDHFLVGDVRAKRTLSELRDRADAVGCRSIGYIVSAIDVMQLIRDGRLDEAERAAHECFEYGVDVGEADATGYYGAHLLTIRFVQDRDSELLDLARDISSASILIKPEFGYRAGAAAIAARAGQHDEAASMLASLRRDGLAALPRSSTWLTGIVNIVEAAAPLGDADLAVEAYALLEPYADRPVMPSLAVTCFGVVERALGLAALTFGDAEFAVTRLERAVEGNIRLGNRPLTAMSRADLAEALVVRGHPGDQVGRRCRAAQSGGGGLCRWRCRYAPSAGRGEPTSCRSTPTRTWRRPRCYGVTMASGSSRSATGEPSYRTSSGSATSPCCWPARRTKCRRSSCAAARRRERVPRARRRADAAVVPAACGRARRTAGGGSAQRSPAPNRPTRGRTGGPARGAVGGRCEVRSGPPLRRLGRAGAHGGSQGDHPGHRRHCGVGAGAG